VIALLREKQIKSLKGGNAFRLWPSQKMQLTNGGKNPFVCAWFKKKAVNPIPLKIASSFNSNDFFYKFARQAFNNAQAGLFIYFRSS
jgi:hypothetical protein